MGFIGRGDFFTRKRCAHELGRRYSAIPQAASALLSLPPPLLKRPSFERAPEFLPPFVLAQACAGESSRSRDILHIALRLDLVASPAHELIGFATPEVIRVRMFRDQIFGFMAVIDAAFPALGVEQRLALARGQVEPAHQRGSPNLKNKRRNNRSRTELSF